MEIEALAKELQEKQIKFVGLATHSQKITVYVENLEQAEQIKNYLFAQGYKEVEIKVIGKIQPLLITQTISYEPYLITKILPLNKEKILQGGISVGGYEHKFTGTLTIIPEKSIGISAWHVVINDNVIQPGMADGGDLNDRIGKVAKSFIDKNVDLSIFKLETDREIKEKFVKGIGEVLSYLDTSEVQIDQEVEKYGRTSGYTKGRIVDKNVFVNVEYHDKTRLIPNCYIIEPAIGLPGDSGSLVLRIDGHPIGMLIAGNSLCTIVQHSNELAELLK